MENYKFRVWHDNQMWEVRAIDWDYKGKIISCHLENDKNSIKVYPDKKYGDEVNLMQYTGLKDKNGKEIYEGDIVRVSNNEGYDDVISKVEFGGEEYPAFDITSYDGYGMNGFSAIYHSTIGEEIELIGNIHENQELLEVLDD